MNKQEKAILSKIILGVAQNDFATSNKYLKTIVESKLARAVGTILSKKIQLNEKVSDNMSNVIFSDGTKITLRVVRVDNENSVVVFSDGKRIWHTPFADIQNLDTILSEFGKSGKPGNKAKPVLVKFASGETQNLMIRRVLTQSEQVKVDDGNKTWYVPFSEILNLDEVKSNAERVLNEGILSRTSARLKGLGAGTTSGIKGAAAGLGAAGAAFTGNKKWLKKSMEDLDAAANRPSEQAKIKALTDGFKKDLKIIFRKNPTIASKIDTAIEKIHRELRTTLVPSKNSAKAEHYEIDLRFGPGTELKVNDADYRRLAKPFSVKANILKMSAPNEDLEIVLQPANSEDVYTVKSIPLNIGYKRLWTIFNNMKASLDVKSDKVLNPEFEEASVETEKSTTDSKTEKLKDKIAAMSQAERKKAHAELINHAKKTGERLTMDEWMALKAERENKKVEVSKPKNVEATAEEKKEEEAEEPKKPAKSKAAISAPSSTAKKSS